MSKGFPDTSSRSSVSFASSNERHPAEAAEAIPATRFKKVSPKFVFFCRGPRQNIHRCQITVLVPRARRPSTRNTLLCIPTARYGRWHKAMAAACRCPAARHHCMAMIDVKPRRCACVGGGQCVYVKSNRPSCHNPYPKRRL